MLFKPLTNITKHLNTVGVKITQPHMCKFIEHTSFFSTFLLQTSQHERRCNGLMFMDTSMLSSNFVKQEQRRCFNYYKLYQPKPMPKVNYIFKVKWPEDRKYTIEPLPVQYLAGRDPQTGRIVVGTRGGGMKHKYLWIDHHRVGPADGTVLEERVVELKDDAFRTPKVALVGSGAQLRYILATENMKVGDLIQTSGIIPRNPVRPLEGNAYPIGALPISTRVNCLEKFPGSGGHLITTAGNYGTVLRKLQDKVVIQMPNKHEYAYDKMCMATVGRLSNVDHDKEQIGSPNLKRQLGFRPRSGLWQRKDGYKGRKIKPLPRVKIMKKKEAKPEVIELTLSGEGPCRPFHPSVDRVT